MPRPGDRLPPIGRQAELKALIMNVMRYTIIDRRGGISFVAHCDAFVALVAACSHNPTTIDQFLDHASFYYHPLKEYVLSGLAVFDERNAQDHYEAIHDALEANSPTFQPVFRVVDDVTREASLRPVKAGAIVFNLGARRIIQMQDSYLEVQRRGRVPIFDGTRLTGRIYHYQLSPDWALVP